MTNAASTDSSNKAILEIAKHTARETRTMKTLTIIALVFVPASFVAVGYPIIEFNKLFEWIMILTHSRTFYKWAIYRSQTSHGFLCLPTRTCGYTW
jgi:hypothetical protein